VEEYGEESAEAIIEMMYEHYENISVIDTDSYDIEGVMEYAKKAGELLDLQTKKVDGSTEILKQLLMGQWEENFIVKKPGNSVTMEDFEI